MADQKYESLPIPLAPGDSIIFYTDGITEAMNSRFELFAKERARNVIAGGPESVIELIPKLIDAVESFSENQPQRDDMCVIALRRTAN